MTAVATSVEEGSGVHDDLAALAALAGRIRQSKSHLDKLYGDRRELFRRLIGQGVSQAQVGRTAGVSSMAVAIALGKAKKPAPQEAGSNGGPTG